MKIYLHCAPCIMHVMARIVITLDLYSGWSGRCANSIYMLLWDYEILADNRLSFQIIMSIYQILAWYVLNSNQCSYSSFIYRLFSISATSAMTCAIDFLTASPTGSYG